MKIQSQKKVRYAVVGAGWISQAAFMPGVAHTGNSVMAALVTGDPKKARALGKKYAIPHVCGYENYDALLASGEIDAVYLALPNDMHLDFSVRTLNAGIHLLLEKPMANTGQDCQKIIDAATITQSKLMVAYRLHFDPANLAAIEMMKSGKIGDARVFSSVFTQKVSHDNHRASKKFWAGPLPDMGPYPINAARYLFRAEPTHVFAFASHARSRVNETISVLMKFPDERVAQFTVGYGENATDEYHVAGTKGELTLKPAFAVNGQLKGEVTVGKKTTKMAFPKTDQFGGELKYFSNCIIKNLTPEPDGFEGLADVRIIKAIERSYATGTMQELEPFERRKRPSAKQSMRLPPFKAPRMIDASAPG